MLSYLTPSMQPQLSSSDSALGMCSSSSDEGNKSSYPNEIDSDGLFNSPHIPYGHSNYPKAPIPFVYGHTPTSAYGFGFNFYNEMSPFTGKYSRGEGQLGRSICVIDSSRTPYTFIHTTKRADPNIDVKLESVELWKRFAELNLEMIITKTGR